MIITDLWRSQPGQYFCITTRVPGTRQFKDHFFKRGDLGRVDEFIADNKDKDVYFCPHGLTGPHRRKEYAAPTTLLWADLDPIDPRSLNGIKPSVAIESSPRRYAALWVADGNTSEELNRRLSYKIGADKGGWDLSQLLRMPGTINYKYDEQPLVRVLWRNGPDYKLSYLNRYAPPLKDAVNGDDATAAIYKKYEKLIPAWCRRELLGKPRPGQRSDVLWSLENTLMEVGLSIDEVFALVKASAWNKFADRADGDAQLRRELDKVVRSHLRPGEATAAYAITPLRQDEAAPHDWLWYPYLERGVVTIIEGDPSAGKSYLVQMIAKSICDGAALPSPQDRHVTGKVAYFDMENSRSTIIVPRLLDNGIKHIENFYVSDQPFTVDDDTDHVIAALERIKPRLIVFDTISYYIGKADTHKVSETTQALGFFSYIARKFNASVIAIRHLTKSGGGKAMYRGQGSIAFSAVARIVLTVGRDPEDRNTRILAMTKESGVYAPPRAFHIVSLPSTLKRDDRSRFTWGEERDDLTADDLMMAPDKRGMTRDAAKEFLTEALADGEVEASVLIRMAEAKSISRRTLYRAADEMGVVQESRGFSADKTSFWALPESKMSKSVLAGTGP